MRRLIGSVVRIDNLIRICPCRRVVDVITSGSVGRVIRKKTSRLIGLNSDSF